MKKILFQRKHLGTNQEPDWIPGNVSILSKILRLINNPGLKTKSEESDQSIPKGLAVFEDEYICYFSKADSLA